MHFFCNNFQDENFSLSLLNELSVKYGIQTHLSHSPLPQKLEELREYIRREIKKELKIKEGAENLRKVAKDRKSVSDVNVIVKKSNTKLTEMQQELQELESQILVSQGNSTTSTPGRLFCHIIMFIFTEIEKRLEENLHVLQILPSLLDTETNQSLCRYSTNNSCTCSGSWTLNAK